MAHDALDAVPGEDAGLLRHFVRRADVETSADAGVLAFRILAHAHHVDVGGAASGERRAETRQQPHRPQIHVLVEALADRKNQIPDRDVIGYGRRANRAEIDGVERGERLQAALLHHPAVAKVVIASPGQLRERHGHAGAARGGFYRREARRHDFAANAIARDHGYTKTVTH